MSCPPKFKFLGDFHKYYNGELKAPFLTLFVGGNHEAAVYLRDLHYGGWVAPNLYYLGAAGVIKVTRNNFSLRIAGISGIDKPYHF
jgi:lariat debranching enzyme